MLGNKKKMERSPNVVSARWFSDITGEKENTWTMETRLHIEINLTQGAAGKNRHYSRPRTWNEKEIFFPPEIGTELDKTRAFWPRDLPAYCQPIATTT